MNRLDLTAPAVKRLLACLGGSVVLAMMVGSQEGTQTDYGFEFRQSVLAPRVFVFLAIGVALFLLISYWQRVRPYLTRPGAWPLGSGALAVVAAQALMHWDDSVGDAKFTTVANAVANTRSISPIASAFFGWLAWTQLVAVLVLGGVAIAAQRRALAVAVAVLAIAAGTIAVLAHHAVEVKAGGVDHSLGYLGALLGYVTIAAAMLLSAANGLDLARSRAAVERVIGFRPGLPLVVLGVVVTILANVSSTWFRPESSNATLVDTRSLFRGTGLAPIAVQYLIWLGWTLLLVTAVSALAATWWRNAVLGIAAAALAVVGAVLTLVTLYDISDLGAKLHVDGASGPWQNLGVGGWMACIGLFLTGGGGLVAALSLRTPPTVIGSDHIGPADRGATSFATAKGMASSGVLIAIAVALFYPPMANPFWQQVLVTEIGISMLLAVGLNVVVGWAGLLDLGFIAFYAIGSYTTAYLTDSLPVKPPSWLHLSPLLAIPFAIVVCLLAGLALGAPTLRLRGDYLAIVTLGFGEIIRIVAVNDPGGATNGSQGPSSAVPNPSIVLGPVKIHWGLAALQYWYLLLVLLGIVIILFRRLENSRLGRSWAAVREDEVAAQATGVNTTRVKLMAFAIGASTSGVAGVFFASQIGSFTPDNFVLQNSILIVAYVVFGGMGSMPGALAGAAMLTWLPEFLKDQVPGPDRNMWIGAVVLLMMIFRPAGLIPARRRTAELSGMGAAASAETAAVPAGEGL